MQKSEQRREERITPPDQSRWHLMIHAHGKSQAVHSVLDISTSGIALSFSEEPLDSKNIFIEYRSHVIEFRVEGAVMWQSKKMNAAGHTHSVLGLKLLDPLLIEAMQGSHG
jgi:hypothetical protein